jgi:hypothetical protein
VTTSDSNCFSALDLILALLKVWFRVYLCSLDSLFGNILRVIGYTSCFRYGRSVLDISIYLPRERSDLHRISEHCRWMYLQDRVVEE